METSVKKTRTGPVKHLSPKRTQTPVKPKNARDLGDEYFISLIEDGLQSEDVSLDEVMSFLRQR
jgi:hypothetical protein